VSIEGGPTERAATAAFGRAMRFAPLIKMLGGINLVRYQLRRGLVAASGDTTWITDAVIRAYTAGAAVDLGATLRAYRAMAASREPEPLKSHLSEITCPVRLLVGGALHEATAGRDEVELLRQSLRSFAVDSQPGAGHYIFEEQPNAVIAAVLRLAAALSSRPGG
jgi:pimeloyl-ACP methyl ester carboxylesterase